MRTMDGDSSTESRGDVHKKRDENTTPLYLHGEGDSSLLHLLEHTPDSGSSYDDRELTAREVHWQKNTSEVSRLSPGSRGDRQTPHLQRSYWETDSSSPSEHNHNNFRQSGTKSPHSKSHESSSSVHDPQLSSSTSSMQSDAESKHLTKDENRGELYSNICHPNLASPVRDKYNASPSTEHDKQIENGSASSGESALQNITVHHARSFLTQKHNSILSQPDRAQVHRSPIRTSDLRLSEGSPILSHHSSKTWELTSSRGSPLYTQDRLTHESPILSSELVPSEGSPLLPQGRKVHHSPISTSELASSHGSPLPTQDRIVRESPISTSELASSHGSPLPTQDRIVRESPISTSELASSHGSPLPTQDRIVRESPISTSELASSHGSPLPTQDRIVRESPISTSELASSHRSPLPTQDRIVRESPISTSELTSSQESPLRTQDRIVRKSPISTSELTPSQESPLLAQEMMAHHFPVLTSELMSSQGSPQVIQERVEHHFRNLTSELTPSRRSPLPTQERVEHHFRNLTSELTPSRGSPLPTQEIVEHHFRNLTSELTPSRRSPLPTQEIVEHHFRNLTSELTPSRGSPLPTQERVQHHSSILPSELTPSRGSPLLAQGTMAHHSPNLTSEITPSGGSPHVIQERVEHHSPNLTSELTPSGESSLPTQERVIHDASIFSQEVIQSEESNFLAQEERRTQSHGTPSCTQERKADHTPSTASSLHSQEEMTVHRSSRSTPGRTPLTRSRLYTQDRRAVARPLSLREERTRPKSPIITPRNQHLFPTREKRLLQRFPDLSPCEESPEERMLVHSPDLSPPDRLPTGQNSYYSQSDRSPVLTQEGRTPILTPDLFQQNRNSLECRSSADRYEWISDSNTFVVQEKAADSSCDSSLTEVHVSTRKKRRQSSTRVRRGLRKNKISPDRGDTLSTRSYLRSVSVASLGSGKNKSGSSPNLSSTGESPCDTNFNVFLAMSRDMLCNTWHYNIRDPRDAKYDEDIVLEDMERDIPAKHASSQTTGELWPPMVDRSTSPYSWKTESSEISSFVEPFPDEANCFCLGGICEIISNFFSVPRNKNH